jgi:hypothetical protein
VTGHLIDHAPCAVPGRKVDTLTYLGDSPARIFESLADSEDQRPDAA